MMLASAKSGAQAIIEEAQHSADGINSEIDSFKAELEKTKTFMQDSLAVLLQRLEYIGNTAEASKIQSSGRTDKMSEIQKKYEGLIEENENRISVLKRQFFH